jgi:hypothetical protein
VGYWTKANTELFVSNIATGYESQGHVHKSALGVRRPLEVDVVVLLLRTSDSDIDFHHQLIPSGDASTIPLFILQHSPPLAIPEGTDVELQSQCKDYIRNITHTDLSSYVITAYNDQETDLSEMHLHSVCRWYKNGRSLNDEVRSSAF